MIRVCKKCRKEKDINDFYETASYAGKRYWRRVCKKCALKETSAYKKTDKYKKYNSNYRKTSEYYKKYQERYRKTEKSKKWFREYAQQPEQKEKRRLYAKSEEAKKKCKVYRRHKFKNDANFRLRVCLRTRLNIVIKKNKPGSAVKSLGCSIEYFKKHIELQFQNGMEWDNWGVKGWHLDHIKPLASFDLTDKKQFDEACHYSNMQPLWAEDNLKKGAIKEWVKRD